MLTPKRTLLTLLVALALAAGTLGPVAAPAHAAGSAASAPVSAVDGPWTAWLSDAAARWAALRAVLGTAPAQERGASLSTREGGTVDPNGKPGETEDGDGPVLQTQEGGTADPDG